MPSFGDRVKVQTATTGTGSVTLGAALAGYQTFASAGFNNADRISYVIEDGLDWEVGLGFYSSSTPSLSRGLIQSSTGSLLNLSGSAVVYVSALAQDILGPAFWIVQGSVRTLTSTTATQQIFNTTTNGALTLTPGRYLYTLRLALTAMSATSGNLGFNVLGAGTASVTSSDSFGFATGQENYLTTGTQSGKYFSSSTTAPIATAATSTSWVGEIRGLIGVSSAGTIVPSINLQTAAAASVVAGSHFFCQRIGGNINEDYLGPWT